MTLPSSKGANSETFLRKLSAHFIFILFLVSVAIEAAFERKRSHMGENTGALAVVTVTR